MNAHLFCPSYGLAHAFWGYLYWEPFTLSGKLESLQFLPTDCFIIHFLLNGEIRVNKRHVPAGEAYVQAPVTALQLGVYSPESQIFSVYLRPSCYHPNLLRQNAFQEKLHKYCSKLRDMYHEAPLKLSTGCAEGYYEILSELYEMISTPQTSPEWLSQVISPSRTAEWDENPQKDLPLCERHFRRKFKQIMGLAPSVFFRLQRFHHALRLRKEKPSLDLIDLISLCKFYDHSHFTREFKHFSGQSPTQFFRQAVPYRELMIPSLLFSGENEVS